MKNLIILCIATLLLFSCTKPEEKELSKFEVSKTNLIIGDSIGGASDSCFVVTEMSWKVSFVPSKPSWLKINIEGATGNDIVFVNSTETNTTGFPRSVTIVLTPSNPSVIPISITVTQPAFVIVPKLETDSAALTMQGRPDVTDSFSIRSNINWTATSSQSWLQLNKVAGNGNEKIIATMMRGNYSLSDSNAVITISPVDNNTIQPIQVSVKQLQSTPAATTWDKTYGGLSDDGFSSIENTMDGGFVAAGYTLSNDAYVTNSHGQKDGWVVKVDNDGNKLWQKTLGGSNDDSLTTIIQSDDGGYVVTGFTFSSDGDVSPQQGGSDAWIVKLSASGDIVWQTTVGGTNNDYANSIVQTTDGGYIVVGRSKSNDGDLNKNQGNDDILIVKIDGNGNKLWTKNYGGLNQDYANSVIATSDNNFLLTAFTKSQDGDMIPNNLQSSPVVIKLNPNGDIIWQKTGSDFWLENENLTCVTEVSGEYFFSGTTGCQMMVAKADVQGNVLWNKPIDVSCGYANAIIPDLLNGGFLIGASRHQNASYYGQSRVTKIDQNGSLIWSQVVPGNVVDDAFYSITQKNGYYVFAGFLSGDARIVKLKPDF